MIHKGEQLWIHIFYAKYGDTVDNNVSNFGNDLIKKLLGKIINNSWVDV